jgi:hypothetical protein
MDDSTTNQFDRSIEAKHELPQKRFKNRLSQNLTLTINEIDEKHFKYTGPQKRVRIR